MYGPIESIDTYRITVDTGGGIQATEATMYYRMPPPLDPEVLLERITNKEKKYLPAAHRDVPAEVIMQNQAHSHLSWHQLNTQMTYSRQHAHSRTRKSAIRVHCAFSCDGWIKVDTGLILTLLHDAPGSEVVRPS